MLANDTIFVKHVTSATAKDPFTMDCQSVQAVHEGKNNMAAVSLAYVEAILTEIMIGKGFFGTVYKGTDSELHHSFAIKSINTEILRSNHSADVQKAKKTFQMDQNVIHTSTTTFLP